MRMSGDWFDDLWQSGSAYTNSTEVDNLTCVASNIQGPVELPYSLTFSVALRSIQAIFNSLLVFAGVLLNGMVIVLVAKYKKLQTHSIGIALQVVALDLLLSLFILLSVINSIANRWLFGEYMCAITGMFGLTIGLARTFLMFVFVIDRYLSVFWTYSYPKHKVIVILCLSIVSWMFSLLVSIPLLPGILDCYYFTQISWNCAFRAACHKSCSIYSNTFYAVVVIPLTIVPVFFYIKLYWRGRKVRKAMVAEGSATDLLQREWKATITFFLLFLSVFLVTLPSITLTVIISRVFPLAERPPAAYVLSAVSGSVTSLLIVTDPIVIMRNKDVREILSKVTIQNSCHKDQNNVV